MIRIKNLTKTYGEKVVYKDFNLDFEEDKILVILGESGSGKTTLLNILAGLTDFSGEILGKPDLVSMVFQKDYLVPNLTVEQNLKLINKDVDCENALKSVGLIDCLKLYPKSLSGGMARRVSILRALIYNSPLLLMDEPTNSLDIGLKSKIYSMIKQLKKEYKKTIVIVTHDIDEALSLADKVVVLSGGNISFSYDFISNIDDRSITSTECNQVREKLINQLTQKV